MILEQPFSFALLGPHAETALTVAPGATFSIDAWSFTPLQSIVGVDWYFALPAGFEVVGRVPTWTPFADFVTSTPNLAGAPQGGVADDVSQSMDGLAILGHYDVKAATAPGSYYLSATALPGSGVVGPAPSFSESEWTSVVGMRVDVTPPPTSIPEPSIGAVSPLLMILSAGFVLLRRQQRFLHRPRWP